MKALRLTRRDLLGGGLAALAAGGEVGAFALPAWKPERLPPPRGRYLDRDGTIGVVGTAIMRPMVERLCDRFAAANPGYRFRLDMRPGLMAIGAITHGTTPFAPMPREFSDMEAIPYRRIVGADPLALRVAHGSVVARDRTAVLALYVHRANPVCGLTLDQAARIFTTGHRAGDITHWGQLGLDGEWAQRPIDPVGTPEDTGFGSYMVREKMGGFPLSPRMTIRSVSKEVLQLVDQNVGAIAYAAVNFDTPNSRTLPIAEHANAAFVAPTEEAVRAGLYPYDRFVYFYLRQVPGEGIEPWIRSYMRLALSREGQQIIGAEAGSFLPLNDTEAARELRRF